jgi:branched-chain amino acid transport system substrate-binding protein
LPTQSPGTSAHPTLRVNARAGQQSAALASWLAKEKPQAKVFYLGRTTMGRPPSRRSGPRRAHRGTSLGSLFRSADSKDHTQYFGQLRAARPQVFTPGCRHDNVRLLTQLQEFDCATISSSWRLRTVTSQNIGAIGKAAEGL